MLGLARQGPLSLPFRIPTGADDHAFRPLPLPAAVFPAVAGCLREYAAQQHFGQRRPPVPAVAAQRAEADRQPAEQPGHGLSLESAGRFRGATEELRTCSLLHTRQCPRRRRRHFPLALRGAGRRLQAPAADLPASLGDECRAGRPVRLPYRSAISGNVTWGLTFRYNAAPVFPPAQTPP